MSETAGNIGRRRMAMGLALVLALGGVMLAAPVPVLDEESYLDIASQLDPARPYDWWRPWQPWGTSREADAFVFAHPPLHLWWVWALRSLVPDELGIRALKVMSGAPWALLYGASVAMLAGSMTRRPVLAVAAWGTAPIVVLGLQRGLMPDLALAALMAAAVAAWRMALGGNRLAGLLGGLALAAAVWTKYPAVLLVPVLLLHARVQAGGWGRGLRAGAVFWTAAALPVLAGEAWLAATYGRLHLVEVVGRAGEISRGDPRLRLLGVLARLSLAAVPAVLLLHGLRSSLVLGGLLGAGCVALAWEPAALDLRTAFRVLPFAMAGGALLVALVSQGRLWRRDRGAGQQGDGLLLAGWALVWIAGVLLVHNFSAPRYLLPAVAPLALLLTRAVDRRWSGRPMLVLGAVVGLVISVWVSTAEHRFFVAADALATQVARAWQSPESFTGEWSFRYRMQAEGWTFLEADDQSGSLVVAAINSSPGVLPEVKERVADYAYDKGGLRVACSSCRVGLYGDTLGVVPLWWSEGPLEEATAWRIR